MQIRQNGQTSCRVSDNKDGTSASGQSGHLERAPIVARTSAAAFAISSSFAMPISFLSGTAWDMAGNVDAALIPIFLGTLPIPILAPTLALRRE
jgi:hypothetical protein